MTTEKQAYINIVGEAVGDFMQLPMGEDGRMQFDFSVGGGAVNAAIGAAHAAREMGLSVGVRFIGRLSTDLLGQRIRAAMESAGVDLERAIATNVASTIALVTRTDARGRDQNGFTFNHQTKDETAARFPQIVQSLVTEMPPNLFVFGGISTVLSPDADHIFRAMKAAHTAGCITILDPNVRPSLIGNLDTYRANFASWASFAHIVKMSDEDQKIIYPDKDHNAAAYTIQRNDGTPTIIVTDGSKRTTLFQPERSFEINSFVKKLDCSNTVGAGDNFNAGLCVGLVSKGLLKPADIVQANKEVLCDVSDLANATARAHLLRQGARERA